MYISKSSLRSSSAFFLPFSFSFSVLFVRTFYSFRAMYFVSLRLIFAAACYARCIFRFHDHTSLSLLPSKHLPRPKHEFRILHIVKRRGDLSCFSIFIIIVIYNTSHPSNFVLSKVWQRIIIDYRSFVIGDLKIYSSWKNISNLQISLYVSIFLFNRELL